MCWISQKQLGLVVLMLGYIRNRGKQCTLILSSHSRLGGSPFLRRCVPDPHLRPPLRNQSHLRSQGSHLGLLVGADTGSAYASTTTGIDSPYASKQDLLGVHVSHVQGSGFQLSALLVGCIEALACRLTGLVSFGKVTDWPPINVEQVRATP